MSSPSSSSLNLSSHPVVLAASALAQAHHAHYDPSHDYHHVTRVKRLALSIAKELNSTSSSSSSSSASPPVDLLVVTLAALTHDLLDAKYLPPGAPSDARSLLEEKLWSSFPGEEEISTEQRRLVERVVENVSYSKEKKRRAAGEETEWHRTCLELHCVQDADKLDAIGAFGIMRCAAYSAITSRPLYLPPPSPSSSAAQPAAPTPPAEDDSAIAHFHDKLFHLESLMKTPKGKELAKRRTEVLRSFVEEVEREWAEGEEL